MKAEKQANTRRWAHTGETYFVDDTITRLRIIFCTLKRGVFYSFQSDNRSNGQARQGYTLAKQADRRCFRHFHVRWSPSVEPLRTDSLPDAVFLLIYTTTDGSRGIE